MTSGPTTDPSGAFSGPARPLRRLGPFDATMLVMGGIVGAGIFINPYVVARLVRSPGAILLAWAIGGAIALLGAFVYAELAARLPEAGGQYAYLREAYHPLVAFLYGWVLLLVIQTGGMAAVAVTFAAYLLEIVGLPFSDGAAAAVAAGTLLVLAVINCLGVRAGSRVQSALMVLKIAAILALVAAGAWYAVGAGAAREAVEAAAPGAFDGAGRTLGPVAGLAAAMVPVLFAYGGWQTANFVAEEVREPRRNLPRALVFGVLGVVALYLAVNAVCVAVLGPDGLAATRTPASAVMERALGPAGARWIAVGIAVSTLGFLSQAVLTAPRVYYAMGRDGLFFRSVGRLDPRSGAPVAAIALQAVMAVVIALSGRYEQILSYVVSMDFLFFGLTATCVFVFRRRAPASEGGRPAARMPGHPVSTLLFVAACWTVVATTVARHPVNSAIGFAILAAGVPAYLAWSRARAARSRS